MSSEPDTANTNDQEEVQKELVTQEGPTQFSVVSQVTFTQLDTGMIMTESDATQTALATVEVGADLLKKAIGSMFLGVTKHAERGNEVEVQILVNLKQYHEDTNSEDKEEEGPGHTGEEE